MLLASLALATSFRFPTSDADHAHFYPTAYYDHGGVTDWACGDITYSGHRGSDFGVGSWTGMDEGRDVVAAADGVVVDAHDGEYDRCSTGDCEGGYGYGNYVKLQHADGGYTTYGHLKQWSVLVGVGETVGCGEKLGEVGSSGYSTGPHLHFEVRDAGNSAYDPFQGDCGSASSRWVSQGGYDELPAPVCEGPVAPCAPVGRISCGASVTGRNDQAGSTSSHAIYGCTEWVYTGPELAWEVATDRDEPVTVALGGLSGDLDVYVLDSAACDGGGCLAASANPDASDESVTFDARAGVTYVVVVDGWEGTVSDFVLSVACAGSLPADDPGPGDTAPDDGGDSAPEGGDPDTGPPGRPPPAATVVDAGGCGCAGAGTGAPWAAGAAALLLLLDRRRRLE